MRSIAVLALKLSALVTVANALKISTIRNPSTPGNGCIIASSNAAGAPVVINQCDVDLVKEDWDYTGIVQNPLPQPLKVFGDKCLDVKDGVNADGTKLQIWDCVPGSTNQLWIHRNDDFTLQWAGTNKCVDLTDGSLEDGNVLQIWTCDSTNYNQKWSSGAVAHPDQGVTLEAMGRPPHLANVCMRAAQNADGAKVQLDICGQPIIPELVWTLPELGTMEIHRMAIRSRFGRVLREMPTRCGRLMVPLSRG
ncbi:hypothetical protein L218DRAFT_967776 [Marasmius fiardii PR-910]|nr:hypothetical protein L218DRAFT_967776 [Marasmius fiardii PR-910]